VLRPRLFQAAFQTLQVFFPVWGRSFRSFTSSFFSLSFFFSDVVFPHFPQGIGKSFRPQLFRGVPHGRRHGVTVSFGVVSLRTWCQTWGISFSVCFHSWNMLLFSQVEQRRDMIWYDRINIYTIYICYVYDIWSTFVRAFKGNAGNVMIFQVDLVILRRVCFNFLELISAPSFSAFLSQSFISGYGGRRGLLTESTAQKRSIQRLSSVSLTKLCGRGKRQS
jgi:hypothetical protein